MVQRYLRYFVFITKHGTYIDGFVRAQKWLPTLPDAARDGTLRHLLTHTSGLIDYEDVMPEGLTEQLRDADVLRLLESQQRTYFAPEAETSPNQGSP
ncbi:MAG TPA: serine hydrolase [Steroidobacteraceae bacterium]|nr:serine hydrolase [Steroidobacteraceae bacterium]